MEIVANMKKEQKFITTVHKSRDRKCNHDCVRVSVFHNSAKHAHRLVWTVGRKPDTAHHHMHAKCPVFTLQLNQKKKINKIKKNKNNTLL